jgi:transcription elongation factor Elf1
MVRSWRRSRRSAHDGRNSPHSKPLSLLTEQKRNWLADADPTRIGHQSQCDHCRAETIVPFRLTRVERRPWRLVWWCSVCGRQARASVPPELVPVMVEWDRAFGTSLSMREVADMVRVDLDELNAAIEDELS